MTSCIVSMRRRSVRRGSARHLATVHNIEISVGHFGLRSDVFMELPAYRIYRLGWRVLENDLRCDRTVRPSHQPVPRSRRMAARRGVCAWKEVQPRLREFSEICWENLLSKLPHVRGELPTRNRRPPTTCCYMPYFYRSLRESVYVCLYVCISCKVPSFWEFSC